MNCSNCGYPLESNAEFCINCGRKIERPNININNNFKSNQPINNQNNQNNKNKIIIISVIICLIILIVIGLIFLNNKNKETSNNMNDKPDNNVKLDSDTSKIEEYTFDLYNTDMPKEAKDDKELSKNVEIYKIFFNPKSTTGKTKEAYVYGKNNNNTSVKVNIEVEYYDSEGYRVNSDATSRIVMANSEFVLQIYVKDDSLDYKTTKLLYSAKKVESYYTEINIDDLEVNDTLLNDGNINVTIKNNSSIVLKSSYLGCIYYKDNKEVFASDGFAFDINPGETGQTQFYNHKLFLKPYDSNQKIEYDNYKVFLYSAYDYDTENY